jgi:hypothetical protein
MFRAHRRDEARVGEVTLADADAQDFRPLLQVFSAELALGFTGELVALDVVASNIAGDSAPSEPVAATVSLAAAEEGRPQ